MTTTTTPTTAAVFRHILTNLEGENTLMMDPAARVVGVQFHVKGVEVFALSTPNLPEEQLELRRFFVAKTGEVVTGCQFLGSAIFPGQAARHVFELP